MTHQESGDGFADELAATSASSGQAMVGVEDLRPFLAQCLLLSMSLAHMLCLFASLGPLAATD